MPFGHRATLGGPDLQVGRTVRSAVVRPPALRRHPTVAVHAPAADRLGRCGRPPADTAAAPAPGRCGRRDDRPARRRPRWRRWSPSSWPTDRAPTRPASWPSPHPWPGSASSRPGRCCRAHGRPVAVVAALLASTCRPTLRSAGCSRAWPSPHSCWSREPCAWTRPSSAGVLGAAWALVIALPDAGHRAATADVGGPRRRLVRTQLLTLAVAAFALALAVHAP